MSVDPINYDNDEVCIREPHPFAYGDSGNITTITNADSPYTTLLDDVIILIDASVGNIDVHVANYAANPNQKYTFKRIDNSANTVTIYPPAAHTIDGTASYNLLRVTEVVRVCRDPATNDYVVHNDKLDRVLTTKGDLYVRNGTKVIRLPVGTNGQVLMASSGAPGGVIWAPIGTVTAKIAYSILQNEVVATTVAYVTVAHFPWDSTEHGMYSGGKVVFRSQYSNRALNIRLVDATNGPTVLGGATNITTTGTLSFSIINPVADAQLVLQIGTESQGGLKPKVFGATLEFAN